MIFKKNFSKNFITEIVTDVLILFYIYKSIRNYLDENKFFISNKNHTAFFYDYTANARVTELFWDVLKFVIVFTM